MKTLSPWSPPGLLAVLLCLLGVLPGSPASAQDAAPGATPATQSLDLVTAVERTIALSPTIQEKVQSVVSSQGSLLVQSSAFDITLGAELDSEKEVTPLDTASVTNGIDQYLVGAWVYGASLTKTRRNGQEISATVSSTYTDENLLFPKRTQTGEVDITFTQPLLQGRGRKATAAGEDAARLTLRAEEYDLRYTIESQILSAVQAYWDYQAAALTLELRKLSEKSTRELQDKTEVLIEADVVPAAERHKLAAEVASKRVDRISAEQDLENARHQLGLTMGLDFDQIEALSLPSTPLPDTDLDMLLKTLEENVTVPNPGTGGASEASPGQGPPRGTDTPDTQQPEDTWQEPEVPQPDLQAILARRNDRLALVASLEATRRSLEGTLDELQPSLDFSLEATLQWYGQENDLQAWDPFTGHPVDPAYTATLTLSYPVGRRSARGAILETQASLRQTEIQLHDLERTIRAEVRLAAREVETRAAQLGGARAAASASVLARHSEENKLELGLSTLTDVLSTEDQVVQAGLQVISAGRAYADAIAQLRFDSGLLRPTEDGRLDLHRLTAIPGVSPDDSP